MQAPVLCPHRVSIKRRFYVNTDALFDAHRACMDKVRELTPQLMDAARFMSESLQRGHKLMICGNGGSAADSQHFAAELVGRFQRERRAIPALALTTDIPILTSVGNDYGSEEMFSRQVDALGSHGDILVAISTSGNSANVLRAVAHAHEIGMDTLGLLGKDGGELVSACGTSIVVSDRVTARVQEAHIFILHMWAEFIEETLSGDS